jgi:hypothetical protein
MPPSEPGEDLIDIERLIGEVAKRHNALLGRDDPIFMAVTLNELIIARALERIEATVEASQDQIAAGTAQQIAASKTIAASLITSAADHVAGQIAAAAAEAAILRRRPVQAQHLLHRPSRRADAVPGAYGGILSRRGPDGGRHSRMRRHLHQG